MFLITVTTGIFFFLKSSPARQKTSNFPLHTVTFPGNVYEKTTMETENRGVMILDSHLMGRKKIADHLFSWPVAEPGLYLKYFYF